MPSNALAMWKQDRLPKLDEIEAAHAALGGELPGRRFTTLQINHSYAVMLSSQFQGLCRDLHEECIDHFVSLISPAAVRPVVRDLLAERKLDRGNPNPGNIGADFDRFGLRFWPVVKLKDSRTQLWQSRLEMLTGWRNAIAHQDFDPQRLSGIATLTLRHVRQWRVACSGLAIVFDVVMRDHLRSMSPSGASPW